MWWRLRHRGGLGTHVKTLAEVLGENGYATTCVGFSGNPASRGFQKYLDFSGWGSWEAGRSPKAENLNAVAIPELQDDWRKSKRSRSSCFCGTWTRTRRICRRARLSACSTPAMSLTRKNKSLKKAYAFKPFCDYLSSWFPPGCTDADYIIAQYDGAIAYMDAAIGNLFAEHRGQRPRRRDFGGYRQRSWRDADRARALLRSSWLV